MFGSEQQPRSRTCLVEPTTQSEPPRRTRRMDVSYRRATACLAKVRSAVARVLVIVDSNVYRLLELLLDPPSCPASRRFCPKRVAGSQAAVFGIGLS